MTIKEEARSIPVVQECDVCVLGGSCTGVFAAVRAAQLGAKVALIEKQNAFGGVAASGLVAIWHRLKDREFKQTVIGGLTRAMTDRLMEIEACNDKGWNRSFNINTEELKIELDKLVVAHGITPYLHTFYARPVVAGEGVKAVLVENKDGNTRMLAPSRAAMEFDDHLARQWAKDHELKDGE